jgi:hypothetical protein
MYPNQYRSLLGALDEALSTFENFARDLSEDDARLRQDLSTMRSQVLKAESGHPFPFKSRLLNEEDSQFDMSATPWFKV